MIMAGLGFWFMKSRPSALEAMTTLAYFALLWFLLNRKWKISPPLSWCHKEQTPHCMKPSSHHRLKALSWEQNFLFFCRSYKASCGPKPNTDFKEMDAQLKQIDPKFRAGKFSGQRDWCKKTKDRASMTFCCCVTTGFRLNRRQENT